MESTRRLGLLRRSPSFGLLFLATAGSGIGTYLAAIALTLDIYARTDSGVWVAVLLIADFLPIVLVGLLLGPLFDRFSRRRLMIASDLARVAVFAALPFVDSPIAIVGLAGVAGVATGFFRPAAYAGLPNLVPDDELTNANSLLQTIENAAWMIGPVLGGVLVSVWSPSVPYAVNAVTFLVSAVLVARIADSQLRSEESITSGHWRDVADGARLVVTALPLRTVLIVWSIVGFGSAAINVAEVFFVRDTLGAGEIGFGVIIGATGLGLVLGSFLAEPALGKAGLRRNYAGSIALMAFGWGGAALSPAIWVAVPFVVGGAAGNGAAIICNQILVQRGAPDRFRGRALSTIMSTNFLVIGLAMGVAGLLIDLLGARWVMISAAAICAIGALFAILLTRWLPVHSVDEDHVLEAYGEEAAGMLVSLDSVRREPLSPAPALAPARQSPREGSAAAGLERIAVLLEEIEIRRENEAKAARRSVT